MDAVQEKRSIGYERVRMGFNPSRDTVVDRLKMDTANLINEVDTIKEVSTDPEVKRLCSLAQTAYEEAAMWAVKAATAGK